MLNIVFPIPMHVSIECLQVSELESESCLNLKFYGRLGIVLES